MQQNISLMTTTTIRWMTERGDTVVARDGERRLVVITAAAPIAQRRRAERVARHVAIRTGFTVLFHASHPPDRSRRHAFVLITGRAVVAYALFQIVAYSRATTWAELDALAPGQSIPLFAVPRWALGLIWVAPIARGQGVAPWLIRTASVYVGATLNELAWAGPFSSAGERLARRMCPEQLIVT